MSNLINIRTATMSQLVAFFNANTGGNPVKKFADRPTAEKRVQRLVDEMAAEAYTAFADGENGRLEGTDTPEDDGTVHGFPVHGQTHCRHCGVHLSNGVGEHNQEVNGKLVKHEHFEYECLACGNEFGPNIPAKNTPTPTGKVRPAMQTTLKLDRRIRNVKTGETWKNAYQLWMANPSWMTSSQVDRLTAQLYSAAKKGYQVTVTINDRDFSLVSVATI